MAFLLGGGYQPAVPPVPPPEELLVGEEAAKGAMRVVVSVMLMKSDGTAVESFRSVPGGVVRSSCSA